MQEYAKHIAWLMLFTFWEVSPRKNYFYSENLPRYIIGLTFTEIPRGGKPEKSLEIFWMKNETIFQFGIRAMKNYADLGGC